MRAHQSTATPTITSFRRGYSTPAALRDDIRAAHQTRTWWTVLAAAADQAAIAAACLLCGWAFTMHPGLWAALAPAAALLVGRQLRALECLVHEGSHFNWSRRRRKLNDALATALAAFPTGARLSGYRESHLRHHGAFGTGDDPDRQRYEELDLEALDRTRRAAFLAGMLRRLPAYQRTWWSDSLQSGLATSLVPPLLWALLLTAGPAFAVFGPGASVGAFAVWLLGFTVALPVLRFAAEASEHSYRDADTVFDATISNLGLMQRGLLHPHNDGYHTVHHLWPGVPHHRLAWLHRRLLASDPEYAKRLRWRARVFANPVRGIGT
ncbi:fatty acid desaturase family protein [Glycomyces buryatensis]|uniref:Fatty acid desaturase domain-containing protein n=1 Tax=Glycomyces buryatensis TaxID=2570927 RepID=A0A4S8Q7K0_9ACTN|nr:fatty acid desaturase family protein [Glycomyces buryatensis]THV38702.1 hypothetical protein FAB82_19945 [Glycomyces buryatensis]